MVEVQSRILMTAENGCGAGFRDGSPEHSACGISLGCSGNHAEQVVGSEQDRTCQREGIFRNFFKRSEAAVMDLLGPAFQVKVYFLDAKGVFEIRNMGIVEGYVAVLSYSHEYYVDVTFRQDLVISGDGFFLGELGANVEDYLERNLVEDGAPEEVAESLWRILGQPYIFIHVEGRDPSPVDSFGL